MKVAELANKPNRWLMSPGTDGAVALSTRARLARNLTGRLFRKRLPISEQEELVDTLIATVRRANGWDDATLFDMRLLDASERQTLVERHLVSRNLGAGKHPSAALVHANETASVMLNEEDHVRLQVLLPGVACHEALKHAVQTDQVLEDLLPWATHPRFGYLTSCPTNVGTGLRVSVMVHLPGLAETNQLGKVLRSLRKLHMTVRGLYGEGSDATGNYFQISNQRTLGRSEEDITTTLTEAVHQIIAYERMAREAMLDHKRTQIEDKVYRAWGLVTHARTLTSEECNDALSWIRLGVATQLVAFNDWPTLDALFTLTQRAHLQLRYPDADEPERRDVLRADLVRKALTGPGLELSEPLERDA